MKSKASEHRPKGGKGDSEDGNVPEPGQPENRQSGRGISLAEQGETIL